MSCYLFNSWITSNRHCVHKHLLLTRETKLLLLLLLLLFKHDSRSVFLLLSFPIFHKIRIKTVQEFQVRG